MKVEATPSIDKLFKHVFDDANELAATTGMLEPVVEVSRKKGVAADPVWFVRRQLIMHLVLTVLRLHDQPGTGVTGTTASIPAVLEAASKSNRMSAENCDWFKRDLQGLYAQYAQQGGDFGELRRFRNAELAHSLERHSKPLDDLFLRPLWDFAHATFELVAELHRYIDPTGMDPIILDNRFHVWRDQGTAFWATYLTPPSPAPDVTPD